MGAVAQAGANGTSICLSHQCSPTQCGLADPTDPNAPSSPNSPVVNTPSSPNSPGVNTPNSPNAPSTPNEPDNGDDDECSAAAIAVQGVESMQCLSEATSSTACQQQASGCACLKAQANCLAKYTCPTLQTNFEIYNNLCTSLSCGEACAIDVEEMRRVFREEQADPSGPSSPVTDAPSSATSLTIAGASLVGVFHFF